MDGMDEGFCSLIYMPRKLLINPSKLTIIIMCFKGLQLPCTERQASINVSSVII